MEKLLQTAIEHSSISLDLAPPSLRGEGLVGVIGVVAIVVTVLLTPRLRHVFTRRSDTREEEGRKEDHRES